MQHLGFLYALYGDLAYPHDACLFRPIMQPVPGSPEEGFNREMSSVRIAVEWGFGQIALLWPWLDFTRHMQVLLVPVGFYFSVANILTNCYTTLYGSQTADYFELSPPSLEQYTSGATL